jgi:hypothetical protein
MLKKRKLFRVAVLVFIGLQWCAVAKGAQTVKGVGVARADESECLRDLPEFKARLEKAGLQVRAGDLECLPVEGEAEAFFPSFHSRTVAEKGVLETAVGTYRLKKSQCLSALRTLADAAVDSNETVVEAGCAPLTISSSEENPEAEAIETYQPTLILFKHTS